MINRQRINTSNIDSTAHSIKEFPPFETQPCEDDDENDDD